MSFGEKFPRIITFQPPQGQPFELMTENDGGQGPGAGGSKPVIKPVPPQA
ncbi:hypothetical protein [Desulfofundulus thermobenzoicus]|nr:hypothetical protein [Desulfofundulus thermobenzoicus]